MADKKKQIKALLEKADICTLLPGTVIIEAEVYNEVLALLDECPTCGGKKEVWDDKFDGVNARYHRVPCPDCQGQLKDKESDERYIGYSYCEKCKLWYLHDCNCNVQGYNPDCTQSQESGYNCVDCGTVYNLCIDNGERVCIKCMAIRYPVDSQDPADHIPEAGEKVDTFVKEIREYFADFIYAENNNVPMQHKPRCLEHDLIEACDRLEAAEKWKDIAYNQAAHIKQLQAKLEAQAKELKEATN